MLNHCLGKGCSCGGSLIPDADCEMNFRAPQIGQFHCCGCVGKKVLGAGLVSYGRNT